MSSIYVKFQSYTIPYIPIFNISPFYYSNNIININNIILQLISTVLISTFTGFLTSRYGYRFTLRFVSSPFSNPLLRTLACVPFVLPILALPVYLTSYEDDYHFIDYIVLLLSYLSLRLGSSLQPVGLTGSISTGKSTVTKILQYDHLQPVVDVDVIARELVTPGHPLGAYREIVIEFGTDVLNDDEGRTLDRTKLGAIVFANDEKRRNLNRITHPKIRRSMVTSMVKTKVLYGSRQVFVDIPLLFESNGLRNMFGLIIVVACNKGLQRERLIKRNPELTEEQCDDRIASQMDIGEKVKGADIVIENDGTLEELEAKVREAYGKVCRCNVFETGVAFWKVVGALMALHNDDGVWGFAVKIGMVSWAVKETFERETWEGV